jgi:hypothetical protein
LREVAETNIWSVHLDFLCSGWKMRLTRPNKRSRLYYYSEGRQSSRDWLSTGDSTHNLSFRSMPHLTKFLNSAPPDQEKAMCS